MSTFLTYFSLSPLGSADENQLILQAKEGCAQAMNTLLRANLPFAFSLAKRFLGLGLDEDDLCAASAIGMWKAIQRFDSDYGVNLRTYAAQYIRNEIFDALNKCGARQYLTERENRKLVQIKKAFSEAEWIEDDKERLEAVSAATGCSAACINELLMCATTASSGNRAVADDGAELFDLLADNRASSPEDAALEACLQEELLCVLKKLEPEERAVFMLANGIGLKSGASYSLSEIGKHFGHSRQWAYWKLGAAREHVAKYMSTWM
ncbi:MAG: sigma-70 family RNA polymerase sigma factor [Treponema sp.]|nr:sigma-70 family RNA polymerase sigma factor [Treponema sp.]